MAIINIHKWQTKIISIPTSQSKIVIRTNQAIQNEELPGHQNKKKNHSKFST